MCTNVYCSSMLYFILGSPPSFLFIVMCMYIFVINMIIKSIEKLIILTQGISISKISCIYVVIYSLIHWTLIKFLILTNRNVWGASYWATPWCKRTHLEHHHWDCCSPHKWRKEASCQDTLSLVSGTRDQLRGSDYREILIVLAKQLRGENTYACKYCISKKYRKPKQNDMNTHSLTSRAIIFIFSINVFLSIRIHV